MNAEKVSKSIAVNFIIFCAITVMLVTIITSMNHSFKKDFVYDLDNMVELIRSENDNVITFNDLIKLKNESKFTNVSGYNEIVTEVSNEYGIYESAVKTVLTDEDYISFYNMQVLSGSFPDADAVEKGENFAVISDHLAVKLFKSIDIAGNGIELLGRKYTVSGVYKGRDSIFWSLHGDGFDRIYIPYSSVNDYLGKTVDVLELMKYPGQDITSVGEILKKVAGTKVSSYDIVEHRVTGMIFSQCFDLLIFALGVFAIILTVILFVKYSINTLKYLGKRAGKYYVLGLIKLETKRIVYFASAFVLCCACIFVVLKLVHFKFYIADEFIPNDNIFDFQFYIDILLNGIKITNLKEIRLYSILTLYYGNTLHFEIFGVLLSGTFIIISLILFRLLILVYTNFPQLIKQVLAAFITSVFISIIASALLGLGIYLPVKMLIIFSLILILRLCIQYSNNYLSKETKKE